jgi:hypothetical protein
MAGIRQPVVDYQSQLIALTFECADEIGIDGCFSCPVINECREFSERNGRLNESTYNRRVAEFLTIKAKRDQNMPRK